MTQPTGIAMIGRHKNVLQVMVAFDTEAEALQALQNIMEDIRLRGRTSIPIHGTADDIVTGKMS